MLDDDNGTATKYQNGLGIDNKLQSKTGNAVKYFLADHLGSTNGLADATGSLTATQSYDAFGNGTNPTFPTRYQFTGREFDNFSGLQYSRARFYDPRLGRFMSEDPIGFRGGDVNLYGYVRNQPLVSTDPYGLWPYDPSKRKYPNRGNLPGTDIPYRMDMNQQPFPNMHVYWPDGSETVISRDGGWERTHGGKPMAIPPRTYRPNLRPVTESFVCKVKQRIKGGFGGFFFGANAFSGFVDDYDRWRRADNAGISYERQMCEDFVDAGPFIDTMLGPIPNPYQFCKGA